MKKLYTILLLALVTLAVQAQNYNTSETFLEGTAHTFSNWTSSNQGVQSSTSEHTITFRSTKGSRIRFDWTVSSEEGYDQFTIMLDGNVIVNEASGEMSDSYESPKFTSEATHTLVFSYSKDVSVNNGSDKATVSNIVFSVPVAVPWDEPSLSYSTDELPTDQQFYLYNIELGMYFTKGTTWGTHAALTNTIGDALPLRCNDLGDGNIQLEVVSSYSNHYVFVSGYLLGMANIYTDYYSNAWKYVISQSYFTQATTASGLRIAVSPDNYQTSPQEGLLLAWNPDNIDYDKDNNYTGTNLGLFGIDPEDCPDLACDWGYITADDLALFEARQALYDALAKCYTEGKDASFYASASAVYNNASSTLQQVQRALSKLTGQAVGYPIDVTGLLTNPSFDTNTEGWTVDMPGAQNKGFQSASYSGSSSISRFVEAWIPNGGYLGAGSILQVINDLPEGTYTLEADAIACDQSGRYSTCSGVALVAESDLWAKQPVNTQSGSPQHYSLTFQNVGSTLAIGMRTTASCTANWMAFDNVRLSAMVPYGQDVTGISLATDNMQLTIGQTKPIGVNVESVDGICHFAQWTSSDETIASVDMLGRVTAHRSGKVTITATAYDSSMSASCEVTVIKADYSGLIINEIQVANIDRFIDPSYNYGGWVELYNEGSLDIPLVSLYVSNDLTNLQMFRLPASIGTLEAGSFCNIWFDHNAADGNYGGQSQNNVNFKLSADGGTIYISDAEGNLIASQAYPASVARCSYARTTDGGATWGMTSQPTPAASNVSSTFASKRLDAPKVSRDGGMIALGETVDFSVDIPSGATLRYTTDGSTPTEDNGLVSSTGRFSFTGTTVFRCALFQEGFLTSPVVTRSFIYMNHDYHLPVLSVVTSPDHLFDSQIGIYTQGTNGTSGNGRSDNCNWNRDWERPVNVEYMVPDKNDAASFITFLNQETDLEIAGGWTRAYQGGWVDDRYWEMRGSFRLKCDKRYEGVNSLDYPVFPNKPFNKYKVWQVRNGGNDNYRTLDAALGQVVLQSGFYVDAQDASPAHIFFNGEYLGMFNIRESNNRHYGDSNYGIDTDDMDQFDLSNAQYNQKVGTEDAWLELVGLAEQLSNNFDDALWQQICQRVDMDEYINYMALEFYLTPADWLTNVNNIKGFRSRTDGKFHFVLFDTDSAFGNNTTQLQNVLTGNYASNVDDFFRYLWEYPTFRRQFVDAFCIVNGSVMNPDFSYDVAMDFYNKIAAAMRLEGGYASTAVVSSLQSRHNNSDQKFMIQSWAGNTPYMLTLSSNVADARLSLNGQLIPTGQFRGYAFNQGNGLTLTAKAPAGYVFKGWSQEGYISSTSPRPTQYLFAEDANWWCLQGESLDGEPWTSTDFDASGYGFDYLQAPFGYASNASKPMAAEANTTLDHGMTFYFRRPVTLSHAPTSSESYVLHYRIDDGLRIHVNGQDVGGYHCNQGAGYATNSTTYEGDTPYEGTLDITPYLKAGQNVIACDVHNTSSTSSDIFFSAWLTLDEVAGGSSFISTDETFCLSDVESPSTYTLEAVFESITNEKQRWEEGATPIRINEVSAGNDIYVNEYYKRNDWVELYNTTDTDIDLEGMYLSDSQKHPQKWQIVKTNAQGQDVLNTVVPAHGRLVVWCDDLAPVSQLHSGFKLSNADGACVSIQDEKGRWADRLTYLEQPRWTTYGRYPDGGNHEQILEQPTIGGANRIGLYDFANVADEDFLSDDISITLAMAEGWNWTSHNLAENVDKSRFTSYADILRGKSSELFLDDVLGWQGRLKTLDATQGYKVNMKQAAEITLRGDLYQSTLPVSVVQGWNWMGCPISNATVLDVALANYRASEGDQIVGQQGFAVYSGGNWTGTLSVLNPGQAYLLKSAIGQQFCWNPLSANPSRVRRYATARHTDFAPWELNIHAYPNVMTMIADVETAGIELAGNYFVGAFSGDECRGVGEMVDGRLFMNVHGEGGEQLSFRLMDAAGDTYTSVQHLMLQDMSLVGSMQAPYMLQFSQKDMDDVTTPSMAKGKAVSRQYYTLSGILLSRPAKGMQVVKTTYEDGTSTSRVVKF